MEPRSNSIWTCNATEISVALHCEHATHERFPALVGLARPNDCLGCRLHSLYVTEHGSGKQRKGESRKAWGPRREASCRWDANDGAGQREISICGTLIARPRALTENQWQMWRIHLQGLVRAVLDSSAEVYGTC